MIEDALGGPLSPEEVELYQGDMKFFDRVATGEISVEHAVVQILRLRRAYRSQQTESAIQPLVSERPYAQAQPVERQPVLSELFAAYASEDEQVRAFRERYLDGELCDLEQVEEWLHQAGVADAKDGDAPVTVRYAKQDDPWQYALRVKPTALIRSLKGLAARLESILGWNEAQGVTFTLSGAVPIVAAVHVRTRLRSPVTGASRIILDIDPATPPREVAKTYSQLRAQIAGERVRPLSEKHLRLALFMARRPDDELEKESFRQWNATYPDDAYNDERNFRRDWREAQEKLLQPKYDVFGGTF